MDNFHLNLGTTRNISNYTIVIDTEPLTVLFCNCLLADL